MSSVVHVRPVQFRRHVAVCRVNPRGCWPASSFNCRLQQGCTSQTTGLYRHISKLQNTSRPIKQNRNLSITFDILAQTVQRHIHNEKYISGTSYSSKSGHISKETFMTMRYIGQRMLYSHLPVFFFASSSSSVYILAPSSSWFAILPELFQIAQSSTSAAWQVPNPFRNRRTPDIKCTILHHV